jgi:hypothetical protein
VRTRVDGLTNRRSEPALAYAAFVPPAAQTVWGGVTGVLTEHGPARGATDCT